MDPKLAEDAVMLICGNCHAGVSPTGKGLVLMNYDREEGTTPSRETALLPFCVFPSRSDWPAPRPSKRSKRTPPPCSPQGPVKGFAPHGPYVYVPAWRLLTTEAGDQAFTALAGAFHSNTWNWTPDRVGLDARPRFVPVTFPENEAREIAWASLFAFHTRASAARLNTMLLKQKLFDAKISFGQGSVALVAFTEQDKVYLRPEVKVARLLIDRGPVLAAQRVTVQAASAAFVGRDGSPLDGRARQDIKVGAVAAVAEGGPRRVAVEATAIAPRGLGTRSLRPLRSKDPPQRPVGAPLLFRAEQHDHHDDRDERGHPREEDLHPRERVLAGDLPGVAVHHHLKRLAAVLVGEQPQRREHVFEGLSGELLLGLQIALGVARYRRGAQGAGGRFHGLPRGRAAVPRLT